MYDWLAQRFGNDAVFMDVAAIPFAVSFPDYIRESIANSKVLIALIGAQWLKKIHQADDPVRMEIETAISSHISVLPVLIGDTPMPNADDLPASISTIASQNAMTIGVSRDFDTHMQSLLPRIESILGALAAQSMVTSDPLVIWFACDAVNQFLSKTYSDRNSNPNYMGYIDWQVIGTSSFLGREILSGESR